MATYSGNMHGLPTGTFRFEITLYNDPAPEVVDLNAVPHYSGSLTSDGLWLESNTAPTSTTLSGSYPALIDGDYYTPAVSGSNNSSIGIDLGAQYEIYGMKIVDDGTAGLGIAYFSGSHDTVSAYYSNDNSSWTLIKTISPAQRVSGSYGYEVFVWWEDDPVTAQYIQLHFPRGFLYSAESKPLIITESVAFAQTAVNNSSGLVRRIYSNSIGKLSIDGSQQTGSVSGSADITFQNKNIS